MSRYAIAGVFLAVYAALAGWLVGRTGEAHRETLKARVARTVPAMETKVTAAPISKPEPKVVPEPPSIPTRTSQDAPTPIPAPAVAASSPSVVPGNPAPTPPVALKDERRTVLSPWANALDLARLKPDDERKLGQELHKLIMETNTRLDAGDWQQRVEQAAAPFLEARTRSEIEYQFFVLDSDAVNAFSHPGGYIYVCRGLFDLIGEDEDYALEFVVGHEIAHVDMKHAITIVALANSDVKKQGVETLLQFVFPIVAGYPDKMEFDADSWVYHQMTGRLRRSQYKGLKFLRKFKGYAEDHKFPNGHAAPDPKANPVDNHFRAHTAAWKRLNHLVPEIKLKASDLPK
jgi:hypothetical protein